MKAGILAVLICLFGITAVSSAQTTPSSAPAKTDPVVRQGTDTPATGVTGSAVGDAKRVRPVTKSPVAKKYTSKKIYHGKDKVDQAKRAKAIEPKEGDKK